MIGFLSFLLFTINLAFSQAKVAALKPPSELLIEVFNDVAYPLDQRVVVVSHHNQKVVALGRVTKTLKAEAQGGALVLVEEIIGAQLIDLEDHVFPLNSEILEKKKIPGFFNITLSGDKNVSSRYKDLVYFGGLTSEGHTLDEKEFLLGPFQFQYGVTDNFSIKTSNSLLLDGYGNLGFKYQVYRGRHAKLTAHSLGGAKLLPRDYIWQGGLLLTLPTNMKFQSHFSVNINFDEQGRDDRSKDLNLFRDTDIRNIYEYVTDDWDRILFGPVYNVQLQTFGGTFSYMWIWDSFHLSLGFATRDFSELSFGEEAYYYVFDLFWRF